MNRLRSRRSSPWVVALVSLLVALCIAAAVVLRLNHLDEGSVGGSADRNAGVGTAAGFVGTPDQVSRGSYLALAGNCAGCHTVRGGAPYAGGLALATPFGTVYSSNLTPDDNAGIGAWNRSDFWRAMHNGRSRDGHLLTPAFPYTSYTALTREDSDALFAFLRSSAPVAAVPPPHELRFPYNTQAALMAWRALYFRPGQQQVQEARGAEWNRGAYLVQALGHCASCHSSRNAMGAIAAGRQLRGGVIPMQGWYAPSLLSVEEAGVAEWAVEDIVALLQTGVVHTASGRAAGVQGPMAEVVFQSTQYLSEPDLRAMAVYLRGLPKQVPTPARQVKVTDAVVSQGERLYATHCVDCHGKAGEGTTGRFPALAGNRAVSLGDPSNVVQTILHGGYLPATAGNPRPFGMPPFLQTLDDSEVAAVASYVRGAWGNTGFAVEPLDVYQLKNADAP